MALVETITETRSYRPNTEDRAVVFAHREGTVIVVTDGVGGRSGGGRAADGVVAAIEQRLPRLLSLHRSVVWYELLEAADADLRADGGGGETTATVVAVTPAGVAGAAVGDSEAWLLLDTGPAVVLAGRRRRKPYLGHGIAVPEAFAIPPLAGTLLVATDGLFKYADPDRIAAVARQSDLTTAGAELAALPRGSDGTYYDDLALVLCRPAADRR